MSPLVQHAMFLSAFALFVAAAPSFSDSPENGPDANTITKWSGVCEIGRKNCVSMCLGKNGGSYKPPFFRCTEKCATGTLYDLHKCTAEEVVSVSRSMAKFVDCSDDFDELCNERCTKPCAGADAEPCTKCVVDCVTENREDLIRRGCTGDSLAEVAEIYVKGVTDRSKPNTNDDQDTTTTGGKIDVTETCSDWVIETCGPQDPKCVRSLGEKGGVQCKPEELKVLARTHCAAFAAYIAGGVCDNVCDGMDPDGEDMKGGKCLAMKAECEKKALADAGCNR